MTKVSTLIDILQRFPSEAEIVFTVRDACSSGYPSWGEVSVGHPLDVDSDDPFDEDESVVEFTLLNEIDDDGEYDEILTDSR